MAKHVTWQLPEERDISTWWNPGSANTTAVTPVTVQFIDETNSENNRKGQCYQNMYGVFPGDPNQFPSTVASGRRFEICVTNTAT